MRGAFSIPHVPVAISDYPLASSRADIGTILRTAGDRCAFLLRRFIDFMATGGPMS
jgi:hypothetical protein